MSTHSGRSIRLVAVSFALSRPLIFGFAAFESALVFDFDLTALGHLMGSVVWQAVLVLLRGRLPHLTNVVGSQSWVGLGVSAAHGGLRLQLALLINQIRKLDKVLVDGVVVHALLERPSG